MAERVRARQFAAEIIELAAGYAADLLGDDAAAVFWAAIRDEAMRKAPSFEAPTAKAPVQVAPMSDEQASAFDQQELPYGKYKGEFIGDIMSEDSKYMHWLATNSDEFRIELNRYLASGFVERNYGKEST